MEVLMPLVIGALFAAGLYLLLRRHVFSMIIGLIIIAHAVNLLLFSSAGVKRDAVAILPEATGDRGVSATADPLPQALVLTAIVIGVGVQAFVLVLIFRLTSAQRSADLDRARSSESEGGQ